MISLFLHMLVFAHTSFVLHFNNIYRLYGISVCLDMFLINSSACLAIELSSQPFQNCEDMALRHTSPLPVEKLIPR